MAKQARSPATYVPQKYAEPESSEKGAQSPDEEDVAFLDDAQHGMVDWPGQTETLMLKDLHRHWSPVGELLSSSEDEESPASIDGYDATSQQASDPMEVASTSEEIDVWENLKQIFADMDAQDGNDENKQLLKEPLTRLRRLLHIHQDVLEKEKALKRCHLGVLVERDWYLRKLRDVEATVASGSLKQSEEPADIAFSGVVRSILYEEAASFKLAGSKGTKPAR